MEAKRLGHGIGDEKRGGKIAFAAVGQKGDDRALAQGAGLVQGHLHGGACAHTYKNSLFTRESAGGFVGRIVVDVDDVVQFLGLENARHVAFLHVFEALDFVAFEGLDADHAHGRIQVAQRPGYAHQRPGGAHGKDDDVDFSAGGLPDFLAGAVVMRLPVGLVVELVDEDVFCRLVAGQAIGLFDCAVGAAVTGG